MELLELDRYAYPIDIIFSNIHWPSYNWPSYTCSQRDNSTAVNAKAKQQLKKVSTLKDKNGTPKEQQNAPSKQTIAPQKKSGNKSNKNNNKKDGKFSSTFFDKKWAEKQTKSFTDWMNFTFSQPSITLHFVSLLSELLDTIKVNPLESLKGAKILYSTFIECSGGFRNLALGLEWGYIPRDFCPFQMTWVFRRSVRSQTRHSTLLNTTLKPSTFSPFYRQWTPQTNRTVTGSWSHLTNSMKNWTFCHLY